MPFVAGAMVVGSAASYFGGKSDAKKMRREMRAWRKLQRDQLKFAKQQWTHYTDTYGDVEKMMVADAMEGVKADYAGVTSRAASDIEGQFDNQIDRQRRQMQAFGLDPSSGRYQSTDRQAGLDLATAKAQGINSARNTERLQSENATWQRRLGVGQFGAGLIRDAGQGVQQAMQNMGNMHGENANTYSSLSGNLFAQAGQMGMYGAMQFGDWMNNRPPDSDGGPSQFLNYGPSGGPSISPNVASEFGYGNSAGYWDAGMGDSAMFGTGQQGLYTNQQY